MFGGHASRQEPLNRFFRSTIVRVGRMEVPSFGCDAGNEATFHQALFSATFHQEMVDQNHIDETVIVLRRNAS